MYNTEKHGAGFSVAMFDELFEGFYKGFIAGFVALNYLAGALIINNNVVVFVKYAVFNHIDKYNAPLSP